MEKNVDKEKVEKEAKAILDKFAKALEGINKEHDVDSFVDREDFEKNEGDYENLDIQFKKRMLENAKNHDDDFIIAETGDWK